MKKDSFVMYLSYREMLQRLTPNELSLMVKAIFDYHENEIEPDFSDNRVLEMCWQPMKSQFDRDKEKYLKVCERNRENGQRGGRPKNNPTEPTEPRKPNGLFKNPTKPKKPDYDYDYVTGTGFSKENIYIGEKSGKKVEQDNSEKKRTQSELKKRIATLFNRRESTAWTEKENAKLNEIAKRKDVLNEIAEIEKLYNSDYPYRRRDVQTFLNNWSTELDRSRCHQSIPPPTYQPDILHHNTVFAPNERGLGDEWK